MNEKITIISFKEEYTEAFKELNLEWIREHFEVEDEDLQSLNNPKAYFLDNGGDVFFCTI